MPNTAAHPTLDHPTVIANSFALDREAVANLASFLLTTPRALGAFIEIHSAADPVQPPVVTVRAALNDGRLGERVVISQD